MSAATLETLLVGHRNEEFTKSVVNAVRYHHADIEIDTVARVILDADAKAREYEIMTAEPRFTVKPLKDWLDLTRFAELLLPAVNQLTLKNRQARWNALSFQGVVYAMPNYVRHLLSRLPWRSTPLITASSAPPFPRITAPSLPTSPIYCVTAASSPTVSERAALASSFSSVRACLPCPKRASSPSR